VVIPVTSFEIHQSNKFVLLYMHVVEFSYVPYYCDRNGLSKFRIYLPYFGCIFLVIYLDRNLVLHLNIVSEFWKILKEYNTVDELEMFDLYKQVLTLYPLPKRTNSRKLLFISISCISISFCVHIVKYLYKLMICWKFHIIPTRKSQDMDHWNIY